ASCEETVLPATSRDRSTTRMPSSGHSAAESNDFAGRLIAGLGSSDRGNRTLERYPVRLNRHSRESGNPGQPTFSRPGPPLSRGDGRCFNPNRSGSNGWVCTKKLAETLPALL